MLQTLQERIDTYFAVFGENAGRQTAASYKMGNRAIQPAITTAHRSSITAVITGITYPSLGDVTKLTVRSGYSSCLIRASVTEMPLTARR
jgi:hypothetical protein